MAEKVVVLSNNSETIFWVPDLQCDELRPVEQINTLTPNGMLLASLGSCTATALLTYAKDHNLDLQVVELRLQCGQLDTQRCADRKRSGKGTEQIEAEIVLYGRLLSEEHDRLLEIAHQCSVHRFLKDGMTVRSRLVREQRAL
jgi:uncharacterized OsmC-like protein